MWFYVVNKLSPVFEYILKVEFFLCWTGKDKTIIAEAAAQGV